MFSSFQLADLPESEFAPLEGYPPEFSQEVEVVPLPDIALKNRKAPTVAVGTKEVPVMKRYLSITIFRLCTLLKFLSEM